MELTEAERRLIEAARKGDPKDYSDHEAPAENDPVKGYTWKDPRIISAETIYQLVTKSNPEWPVHAKGVRVKGVRVKGRLDFEAAELKCPLVLNGCYVEEDINLTDASARSIDLTGTHLFAIHADGLTINGSLFLDEGFRAKGDVSLIGANIDGQFVCTNGIFEKGLNADFMKVGTVGFNGGFNAEGEVRLVGAKIDGQLRCGGGTFKNGLSADGLKVSDVFLNVGVNAKGQAQSFNATGEVTLVGAEIDGQLQCGGGAFESSLKADGLKARDVFLNKDPCTKGEGQGFKANGDVNLAGAEIGGELNCSGGTFEGNLDLRRVHAGALADDPNSWPKTGKLLLDGFEYGISSNLGVPRDAKSRLDWIELGPKEKKDPFLPQPYEQLVKVLHAMGDEAGARKVSIKEQCALRRRGKLGPLSWLWNWFLCVTVGYGYLAWLPLLWVAVVVVAGGYLFRPAAFVRADSKNPIVANAPAATPQKPLAQNGAPQTPHVQIAQSQLRHPFLYSIDVFLPFADLNQKKTWQLDEKQHFFIAYQIWYLFEELAGWVLTGLLAAAATGLLKK